jgi:hypothetical protein
LAIVCLLASAGAGTLSAQRFEISPNFGYNRMSREPLGSLSSDNPTDDDVEFRDGKGAGVRFTWNTKGYYGHEFGYVRNRPELTWRLPNQVAGDRERTRVNVDQLFYNFMIYFMPAGEKWRPFITGGLQGFQYGVPGAPEWSNYSKSRNYGANYGGGIKLMPFHHFIIRFDFRHYMGGKPYDLKFKSTTSRIGTPQNNQGGIIHQLEGSAGIAIAF